MRASRMLRLAPGSAGSGTGSARSSPAATSLPSVAASVHGVTNVSPELVLRRACDGRIQLAGAEKQGPQHVRGGAALTGRRRIGEVDSGRHEPLNERWVRHPYKELSRRRPESEQRGLLYRVEREEGWAVEGITAADGDAGVSHRHAQLHRIERWSREKRRTTPTPRRRPRRRWARDGGRRRLRSSVWRCVVAWPSDTGGQLHHGVKTTHRGDTISAVAKPFPSQLSSSLLC